MYIAQKRCGFAGKTFYKGNEIPQGFVHETAAPRLIGMGVIAEASQGRLLLVNASIEDPAPPSYTEEGLMKLRRDELSKIATNLGIKVEEEHTKRMITAFILEVQAGK